MICSWTMSCGSKSNFEMYNFEMCNFDMCVPVCGIRCLGTPMRVEDPPTTRSGLILCVMAVFWFYV